MWINTNERDPIWATVYWTDLVDLTTLGGWMRARVTRYWWAARRHVLAVPWNEEKLERDEHCLLARPWNHTSDWIKNLTVQNNGQKHVPLFQDCRGKEPPSQRRVSNYWRSICETTMSFYWKIHRIFCEIWPEVGSIWLVTSCCLAMGFLAEGDTIKMFRVNSCYLLFSHRYRILFCRLHTIKGKNVWYNLCPLVCHLKHWNQWSILHGKSWQWSCSQVSTSQICMQIDIVSK